MSWETTWYFDNVRPRKHPELDQEMIRKCADSPQFEAVQSDGRIRRWRYVNALQHWIRVIIEPDERTLHNAFVDSGFDPKTAAKNFGAEEV